MKNMRRIAILILALLLGVLPLLGMSAVAETAFQANEWVVLSPNVRFYEDAGLTKSILMTMSAQYRLVKLSAVKGNVGAIVSGNRIEYISLKDAAHLQKGLRLYAKQSTRIYQKPSLKSKYANVKNGIGPFVFRAISGDCIEVQYNNVVGYMNINHMGVLIQQAV